MRTSLQVGGFLQRRAPGTVVRLELAGPGLQTRLVALTLAELPRGGLFNGLGVRDDRAVAAPGAAASPAAGLLVASVEPDSAAAAAGLREGDRILSIDGVEVRSVEDYESTALSVPRDRVEVRLVVRRPGEAEPRTVVLR